MAVSIGPPDGRRWAIVADAGRFVDLAGPMFVTDDALEPDEAARFGFRVQTHQCNCVGVCHGGMLATFLDVAMARVLLAGGGVAYNVPTISLSLDYLAPVRLGEWVKSRIAIVHRTRRMAFLQAVLRGDDGPVVRGNAVFRARPLA